MQAGEKQEEQKTTTSSLATTVQPQKTTNTSTPTQGTQKNTATVDIGTIHRSWNGELSDLTTYKVLTLSVTVQDKLGNAFI